MSEALPTATTGFALADDGAKVIGEPIRNGKTFAELRRKAIEIFHMDCRAFPWLGLPEPLPPELVHREPGYCGHGADLEHADLFDCQNHGVNHVDDLARGRSCVGRV